MPYAKMGTQYDQNPYLSGPFNLICIFAVNFS
jgi:hypothetical protein